MAYVSVLAGGLIQAKSGEISLPVQVYKMGKVPAFENALVVRESLGWLAAFAV